MVLIVVTKMNNLKTYRLSQETRGILYYTVTALSEEEAIQLVESGDVDYDEHEWDECDAPFVDEVLDE